MDKMREKQLQDLQQSEGIPCLDTSIREDCIRTIIRDEDVKELILRIREARKTLVEGSDEAI